MKIIGKLAWSAMAEVFAATALQQRSGSESLPELQVWLEWLPIIRFTGNAGKRRAEERQ